jgi:hypothetical protein
MGIAMVMPCADSESNQWRSGRHRTRKPAPWAIYHIRGTPARFIGIVYDAPDEQSATEKAIAEYGVPKNQR